MLPLKNRLKNKKDFDAVFKKGKKAEGAFLFLKAIKNNLNESRFGFVVSQKVNKKAVARNRIKRKLREIAKTERIVVKEPRDIVVLVKKDISQKKIQEIKPELVRLLEKINKLD